ncbi:unnamed protein product [Arabis nemorensis]|uniref:Uncharacterized protein n=1 Tax=Arabis nemorensis TaxID=586526 RepID=A0A565ASC4_9BRAS|nr:unnamed protein product [Arabis nemorensis]
MDQTLTNSPRPVPTVQISDTTVPLEAQAPALLDNTGPSSRRQIPTRLRNLTRFRAQP